MLLVLRCRSSELHSNLVGETAERTARTAERLRSREAAEGVDVGEMRLERGEAGVAVVAQGGEGLEQLPVPLAGGRHLAGRAQRVLHLQVLQVRSQQPVAVIERALDPDL